MSEKEKTASYEPTTIGLDYPFRHGNNVYSEGKRVRGFEGIFIRT